jgi:hypothetical protein
MLLLIKSITDDFDNVINLGLLGQLVRLLAFFQSFDIV